MNYTIKHYTFEIILSNIILSSCDRRLLSIYQMRWIETSINFWVNREKITIFKVICQIVTVCSDTPHIYMLVLHIPTIWAPRSIIIIVFMKDNVHIPYHINFDSIILVKSVFNCNSSFIFQSIIMLNDILITNTHQ